MTTVRRILPRVLLCAVACLTTSPRVVTAAETWHATGKRAVVVAGAQEAVDAGLTIARAGGNAADAAVATILALSVTDHTNFCFGGEVPILFHDAKTGRVHVIAGQGAAPALATLEHFQKRGGIPTSGVQAAAVPAALDACVTLLERFGTQRFAVCAAPTLKILDHHKLPWHADLAKTLRTLLAAEAAAPTRGAGLRAVADCFYRGQIAQDLDVWCQMNGGLIRAADLAAHTTPVEDSLTTDYRGFTVHKCGVWTQGPFVLQALQLLSGFDVKALGPDKPETIHLTIEAMKLAMADRDAYFADPKFADVPTAKLLAKEYSDLRRSLIDRDHAALKLMPGDPRRGKPHLDNLDGLYGPDTKAQDTTTCLVADASGNVVAATPSGWSGVLAGHTGVWLGSRLQSFNTWPKHPNCIEPGKRPRITLTPTLVLKDKKPVYAVSVAGGDGQDQATLQMLLNVLDFQRSIKDTVTTPRFGTTHYVGSFGQTRPELGSLALDSRFPADLEQALAAKGHVVSRRTAPLWAPTILFLDPQTGQLEGAGDPKAHRHAGAW